MTGPCGKVTFLPIPSGNAKAKPKSKKLSGSIYRTVKKNYNRFKRLVIFETALAIPENYTAINGHRVNRSALCPSVRYPSECLIPDGCPFWNEPRKQLGKHSTRATKGQ